MICYCKMYTFYERLDRGLEEEYRSKNLVSGFVVELYLNKLYMGNVYIFFETEKLVFTS